MAEEFEKKEEEIIENDFETNEEEVVETKPQKRKGKAMAAVISVVVVLVVAGVVLTYSLKKPQPQVEKPFEDKVEDVIIDDVQNQTGISNVEFKLQAGETLPYVISVSQDSEGNSKYMACLIGDYEQYVNVDPSLEDAEFDITRVIMGIELSKDQVASQETVRAAIAEAKEEDMKIICTYGVDQDYEEALVGYCSSLEGYEDKLDWESAKLVKLDDGSRLDGVAREYITENGKCMMGSFGFVDNQGQTCVVELKYEPYANAREKKSQYEIINGYMADYTPEMFEGLNLLTDEEKELIAEPNLLNMITGNGSYKDPVLTVEPEVQDPSQTISK
ncbi:MAG: hypothetical protein E7184_03045 [Erysipelotrichaceae bacterium]|nr:hypothetical protein [Erysipelotrichaceae bacterium]